LFSEAYQSSSQRFIPTAVKSGSSRVQKRRSFKLLDLHFGYFRLPRGLSRRTRHYRSMAVARHGMCELTARYGRGTAWTRHGRGTAWARHGRGTAWTRHAMCELTLIHTQSFNQLNAFASVTNVLALDDPTRFVLLAVGGSFPPRTVFFADILVQWVSSKFMGIDNTRNRL